MRRIRLWFRRRSRDNIVLAVVATVAAAVARPFKRVGRRTVIGVMVMGAGVLLGMVLLANRGSSGPKLVQAAEDLDTTARPKEHETTTTTLAAATRDAAPPSLLIDSNLVDGLVVGTDHLVISGLTDAGATVVVAGIEVTADDAGIWAADVPLVLGPNRIEVLATDAVGNAAGFAFTVVYQVDAPPPPASARPPRPVARTTSTVEPVAAPPAPTPTIAATTTASATTSRRTTTSGVDVTTTTLGAAPTTQTTDPPPSGPTVPTYSPTTAPTTQPTTTLPTTTTTDATTTTESTTTTAATSTTESTTTTVPD